MVVVVLRLLDLLDDSCPIFGGPGGLNLGGGCGGGGGGRRRWTVGFVGFVVSVVPFEGGYNSLVGCGSRRSVVVRVGGQKLGSGQVEKDACAGAGALEGVIFHWVIVWVTAVGIGFVYNMSAV